MNRPRQIVPGGGWWRPAVAGLALAAAAGAVAQPGFEGQNPSPLAGSVGFDTMAQRLVQRAVWEIDGRFK